MNQILGTKSMPKASPFSDFQFQSIEDKSKVQKFQEMSDVGNDDITSYQ